MKPLRGLFLAAFLPALCAQTVSVHDLIATARQRIESTDVRASGHLQWVPETGPRVSYPIAIRAHWFPGVLRIRADIGQPSSAHRDMREHILIEMRPNGDNTIRIADPGDKAPHLLSFEQWSTHPLAPGFSYEDLLEQQVFWAAQTAEGDAKFGARNCEVIKSTPGPNDKTHDSAVKTWYDPTIGFPVYVEKTIKDTGAVKEITYLGIRREEGVWSAREMQVQVRGQHGSTILTFDRGTPKANLTLDDFSPAQLVRF